MRILLVEDDKETSAYLRAGLQEEGFLVSCSFNGREGLFLASTSDFDLLIVDRMLPQLDGLSLVRTLRSAHIETPVLFLTTMSGVDDRGPGSSGGDDYLVSFAFPSSCAVHAVSRLRRLVRTDSFGLPIWSSLFYALGQTAGIEITLQRVSTVSRISDAPRRRSVTRTMPRKSGFHFDPTPCRRIPIEPAAQQIAKGDHALTTRTRCRLHASRAVLDSRARQASG